MYDPGLALDLHTSSFQILPSGPNLHHPTADVNRLPAAVPLRDFSDQLTTPSDRQPIQVLISFLMVLWGCHPDLLNRHRLILQ